MRVFSVDPALCFRVLVVAMAAEKEARLREWQNRCEDCLVEYSLAVAGHSDWMRMNWIEPVLRHGRTQFACTYCGKELECVAYCHEHIVSKRHRNALVQTYPDLWNSKIALRECWFVEPTYAKGHSRVTLPGACLLYTSPSPRD